MRLSGSVKLRCAFGSGAAAGGGLRGGFSSTFARAGCSAAALAFASASNSALAWRILASRACLSATSPASRRRAGRPRTVLRGVRRLRSLEPAVNLGLQLGLPLAHALVAHRLVLGRIRLDLGAREHINN